MKWYKKNKRNWKSTLGILLDYIFLMKSAEFSKFPN